MKIAGATKTEIRTFAQSEQRLGVGVRVHLAVLAVAVGVLVVAGVFAEVKGISGSELTREPQVTLEGKLWVGAISNLGALIWMLGAVMAFVGAMTVTSALERQMFLAAGLLGTALLVDDFFLVHDYISYHSTLLERALIVGYMVGVVVLVLRYWRIMGPLAVLGVLATLGLLAMSVVLDNSFNGLDQIIEDGFKFLGISAWATTWTLRARPWTLRQPRIGAVTPSQ